LDALYPVVFVDAIVVKVRDGQVRNTPFYAVRTELPVAHV
jgi:transposase-like protein